ncbi:hypothetical protein B7494_g3211 [Chlorociboria aeruginascens]|nr:hypothetical protein B7494_g3211 [Chlorociboria aeruginascens]
MEPILDAQGNQTYINVQEFYYRDKPGDPIKTVYARPKDNEDVGYFFRNASPTGGYPRVPAGPWDRAYMDSVMHQMGRTAHLYNPEVPLLSINEADKAAMAAKHPDPELRKREIDNEINSGNPSWEAMPVNFIFMGSAGSALSRRRKQNTESRSDFQSYGRPFLGSNNPWLGNEVIDDGVQARPIKNTPGVSSQIRDNFRNGPTATSNRQRSTNPQPQGQQVQQLSAMEDSNRWTQPVPRSQISNTKPPIVRANEVYGQTFPQAKMSESPQAEPQTGKNVQRFWDLYTGTEVRLSPEFPNVDYYYHKLNPEGEWRRSERLYGPIEMAYREWIRHIPMYPPPKVYDPTNRAQLGKMVHHNLGENGKYNKIAQWVHDNEAKFWNYEQEPKAGESSLGWNIIQEQKALKAKYPLQQRILMAHPERAGSRWKPLP